MASWFNRIRLRRTSSLRWLGDAGERVAARHLHQKGYRLLARNLRFRFGEIDLMARAPDGRTVVVVEVKSGTGGPIRPEVHVSPAKQRKLVALASQLIRRFALDDCPVRFDVVGVDFQENGSKQVRHHVGAFESHV